MVDIAIMDSLSLPTNSLVQDIKREGSYISVGISATFNLVRKSACFWTFPQYEAHDVEINKLDRRFRSLGIRQVTVRGTVPFDFISLILLCRGEGWRIAACQSLSSAPAASPRGWISVHNHHTPETTSEACFCTDSFVIACPVVFYTES